MLRDLLRILLAGAFIIAIGVLVADEVMSSVLDLSRRQVERSDLVSRDAQSVLRRIIDLETGVRGHVLTGDERFL